MDSSSKSAIEIMRSDRGSSLAESEKSGSSIPLPVQTLSLHLPADGMISSFGFVSILASEIFPNDDLKEVIEIMGYSSCEGFQLDSSFCALNISASIRFCACDVPYDMHQLNDLIVPIKDGVVPFISRYLFRCGSNSRRRRVCLSSKPCNWHSLRWRNRHRGTIDNTSVLESLYIVDPSILSAGFICPYDVKSLSWIVIASLITSKVSSHSFLP